MNGSPVSSRVLEAAIAWKLSLDEGSGTPDERNAFMRWHAASEEHAAPGANWAASTSA